MFVGQPELKVKLKSPNFSQLAQRIIVNYHLMPLTQEETGLYIASRLEKAGCESTIFTKTALERIYFATKGVPRLVNLLCDSALVYGFASEVETIDEPVILHVIEDKGDIGLVSQIDSHATDHGECENLSLSDDQNRLDFSRIVSLEKEVQQLKMQMQWQIEELEKRAENYKDDLIRQLKAEIEEERKLRKNYMVTAGRLKQKYEALRELHASEGEKAKSQRDKQNQENNKKLSWFRRNIG